MVAMTKGIKHSVAEGHPNGLKLRIITLTAAVLVAFFIRMLSYASVTANGGITLSGYDQFYHMRRILYTAYNFPHTLNFDSYLNYPYGFEIGWPLFLICKVLCLQKSWEGASQICILSNLQEHYYRYFSGY